MGVWSTSRTRRSRSHPVIESQPCSSPSPPARSSGFAGGRPAARAAGTPPLDDEPPQIPVEHVADQRALAAAADPGDADQPPERDLYREVLQIVQACAAHLDAIRRLRPCAAAQRVDQRLAQKSPGHRLLRALHVPQRPGGDHASAVDPGARPEIDEVLRGADRLLVVLDHDHGVPGFPELLERREEQAVVPGVQADGRLVEDVADAAQARSELRGESDALGLAAAQGRGGAVELEVAKADAAQERRAGSRPRPAGRGRSRLRAHRASTNR